MEMESTQVLDQLVEERVFEEADEETLALTDEFRATLDGTKNRLGDHSTEQLRTELSSVLAEEELVQFFTGGQRVRETTAAYLALSEYVTGVDEAELVSVVPIVEQLQDESPRDEGAPEAFLPVSGDSLERLFELHPRAIVYVWMDDCNPCDLMRSDFDDIFTEPDDEIGLFAVYGPDWAELLAERYDVAGAPTTLFVLDGAVDARLQGSHHRDVVESEIRMLREA